MTGRRSSSRRSRNRIWVWFAGSLGLVLLDQVTKLIVRARIPLAESVPVIGEDFLRLTHVQNTGIAFGLQILGPVSLLVFGWAAAIALAVYLYQITRERNVHVSADGSRRLIGNPLRWPITLFLAGAVGNSIDRLLFGRVTDFLDVDFPDWIMPRWPVFNIADSCVTIGIILLIIIVLFDRSPHAKTTAAAEPSSPLPPPDDRSDRRSHSLPDHNRPGTAPAAD